MGLLDFLFGKQKHHAAPDLKAQSQRYDQGYHYGYRDAYEEGTCEDWECTCENQDFDSSDSSFDTHPDEDTSRRMTTITMKMILGQPQRYGTNIVKSK